MHWGYESPCGVMSRYWGQPAFWHELLRIPMRGYETIELAALRAAAGVTNPHAGL